ncbi:MAG TPA: hypothetical protein VM100_00230 [Longimicrobiales bacterium]|nr:hypothetical protein [Longimicrobiales bacterium]
MNQIQTALPGLEAFWETCDHDSVGDHPLMRELCFRLDAIQRYRFLIDEAEENGNDDAVTVLSTCSEQQQVLVQKIRDELARTQTPQERRSPIRLAL